jgi:hypothetical protein
MIKTRRIVTESIPYGNRYYVIETPINETHICYQFETKQQAEYFIELNLF